MDSVSESKGFKIQCQNGLMETKLDTDELYGQNDKTGLMED